MKELSKTQFAIFALGGILMAVGAGCMALGFMVPKLVGVTSWLFLLGTVLFSVTQATQVYEGNNLTIRRLKNIQYFADLCFILSGISCLQQVGGLPAHRRHPGALHRTPHLPRAEEGRLRDLDPHALSLKRIRDALKRAYHVLRPAGDLSRFYGNGGGHMQLFLSTHYIS